MLGKPRILSLLSTRLINSIKYEYSCKTLLYTKRIPLCPTRVGQITYTIIRIFNECEGGIEKSISRITVWYHKACRVMTNGDHEGRIFLSFEKQGNHGW